MPWKSHAPSSLAKGEPAGPVPDTPSRAARLPGYESRLGALAELLPSGLADAPTPVALFLGREHLLGYLNDAGRALFGPRPLSEPITHALPELVAAGVGEALERVMRDGVAATVPEARVECYGERHHTRVLTLVCSPVRSPKARSAQDRATRPADEVAGVLMIGLDVSERAYAVDRLREGERRHRYAAVTLQRSLLPHRLAQPDEVRVAGCYLPGADDPAARLRRQPGRDPAGLEVGGDWYDVIALGGGRTGLVIGDVMGRGLHAAAVMGQLRAALRAYAGQNLSPGEVLLHLDRHAAELAGGVMATVLYAIYDPADSTLVYARAGHLPALLRLPGGRVVDLDGAGGPPMGTNAWDWQEATIEVPADSYLVLFTDGLIERRDTDIDESLADLRQLLADAVSAVPTGHPRHATRLASGPVDMVRDHLLEGVRLPADHADDVALLVMHVPHWSGSRAELYRSAAVDLLGGPEIAAHARAFATGVLASWHVGEDLCDLGVMAVSELVANAVTHGLPPVRLSMRRTDRRLIIDVRDGDDHLPRRRLARELDENGRGIGIVSSLATNWGARATPEGKSVWCEFPLR